MTTLQTPIDAVDLLMWLRRRDALSGLPCPLAEDARILSQLHKAKTYKSLGLTWNQFCRQRLHFGYDKANQIIRHYREFGPTYFVLKQLTRIRTSQYRRIRVAISGNVLHHDGVEIPITAENRHPLTEAIQHLLRAPAAARSRAHFQDASQNVGSSLQPAETN